MAANLEKARLGHLAFHRQMVREKAQLIGVRNHSVLTRAQNRGALENSPRGGLLPAGHAMWEHNAAGNAARAKYNTSHGWDAGLDALRTKGLDQKQYDNLLAGKHPGGFGGAFGGMTPAQLKQVASFVNKQGSMQDEGPINPITGKPDQSMHFAYNDPRAGEAGEAAQGTNPWDSPYQQPHPGNGFGHGGWDGFGHPGFGGHPGQHPGTGWGAHPPQHYPIPGPQFPGHGFGGFGGHPYQGGPVPYQPGPMPVTRFPLPGHPYMGGPAFPQGPQAGPGPSNYRLPSPGGYRAL